MYAPSRNSVKVFRWGVVSSDASFKSSSRACISIRFWPCTAVFSKLMTQAFRCPEYATMRITPCRPAELA